MDGAAGHRPSHDEGNACRAVVRAAGAVDRDRPPELACSNDRGLRPCLAKRCLERGEALIKGGETAGELAIAGPLVEVRIPASDVEDGNARAMFSREYFARTIHEWRDRAVTGSRCAAIQHVMRRLGRDRSRLKSLFQRVREYRVVRVELRHAA